MKQLLKIDGEMIKKIYSKFDNTNSTISVETEIAPFITNTINIKTNIFKKILMSFESHRLENEIYDIDINQEQSKYYINHKVTNTLYKDLLILSGGEFND